MEDWCKTMKKLIVVMLFAGLAGVLGARNQNRFADFSLKSLQTYPYKASAITVEQLPFKNSLQYAFNVSYISMGYTVSARLSIPAGRDVKGMVIMLRGHQNAGGYYTGKGTENPARGYLQRGWAIMAPDFFGYGSSSPTPAPEEMHQFYSTVNAVELYKSLEKPEYRFVASMPPEDRIALPASFKKLALWGHSNGGQAAIHFLEIIKKPVPTVLWAPVCIPFPDNWAHYRRRLSWAEQFKRDYPAADYSLFSYLDRIAPGTPVFLEQGDKDTAVPREWSDAFAAAIGEENTRREKAGIGKIGLRYQVYRNANHNLNPYWSTVLADDVEFWDKN
jgi:dienelactone hydrolase